MNLEQLVMAAQSSNRDETAFAEICRRFAGLVAKYAAQPHLARIREEAAAEGWLAVATAVRTYDRSAGVHFAGYVESRIRYAVWNLFKRERRRWQQELSLTGNSSNDDGDEASSLLDSLTAADDVEREVEAGWTRAAVRQAIVTLPDKQRLVVDRTLLGQAHLVEVAGQLGISPQAVYNLRQRALARLKKELAGMYRSKRG